MCSWSTLVHERATGEQRLTRLTTAQTWGKPSPSPLQYTLCLTTGVGLAPKCHFVQGLPSGSFKIPKVVFLATLGAHNFVCKPPIGMRSKAKLQPLLRTFQWHVARHMNARKLGRFLTFSGQESIVQFDSQPFFWP